MRIETSWFKNKLIDWFIKHYPVNLKEADITDPHAYRHFNHFFTRSLQLSARPIAGDPHSVISPADGCISQIGQIREQQLLQAKGRHYSLVQLLGSSARAAEFAGGQFVTIYLAPKDYHRVHMPLSGKLLEMSYVPGCLFSVNRASVGRVPRLFARNERVVCVFATEQGTMIVVMVGAMLVASIVTSWFGQVTPRPQELESWSYENHHIYLQKGGELGYFQYGSTVITLLPPNVVSWRNDLQADSNVRMGQEIGTLLVKG